jgi:hypothetical protein
MLLWLHMHDGDFDHSVENADGGRDASTIYRIERLCIVAAPGEHLQLRNAKAQGKSWSFLVPGRSSPSKITRSRSHTYSLSHSLDYPSSLPCTSLHSVCDYTLSPKTGPNTMVKLTEVEDEHFADKPSTTKDDALLASDDDDDYTDTGAMIPYLLKLATPVRGPRRSGWRLLSQSNPASIFPSTPSIKSQPRHTDTATTPRFRNISSIRPRASNLGIAPRPRRRPRRHHPTLHPRKDFLDILLHRVVHRLCIQFHRQRPLGRIYQCIVAGNPVCAGFWAGAGDHGEGAGRGIDEGGC